VGKPKKVCEVLAKLFDTGAARLSSSQHSVKKHKNCNSGKFRDCKCTKRPQEARNVQSSPANLRKPASVKKDPWGKKKKKKNSPKGQASLCQVDIGKIVKNDSAWVQSPRLFTRKKKSCGPILINSKVAQEKRKKGIAGARHHFLGPLFKKKTVETEKGKRKKTKKTEWRCWGKKRL